MYKILITTSALFFSFLSLKAGGWEKIRVSGSEKLCQSCPFELIAEEQSSKLPISPYLSIPGVSMSVLAPVTNFGFVRGPYQITNSIKKHIRSSVSLPGRLKRFSPKMLKMYGYEPIKIENDLQNAIISIIDNPLVQTEYYVQFDAHESFTSVEEFSSNNSKTILGLSFFQHGQAKVALNVHQDFFTGSSTFLHELFHLHDPYLKQISDNKLALGQFIAEYRAFRFEAKAFPYLKKHFGKERKYLKNSIGNKFDKLSTDEDFIEEVLERIYPTKKKMLPKHLVFSIDPVSKKISIQSHYESLQLDEFSNTRFYLNIDRVLKNTSLSSKQARVLPSLKLLQGLPQLQLKSSDDLNSAVEKLVKYLEKQIIEENILLRKSLNQQLGLSPNSSKSNTIKALKKHIKANKLNDVTKDLQLNEAMDWIGPKGTNGGD